MTLNISPKLFTVDNVVRGIGLGMSLLKKTIKKIPLAVNYDLTWKCNLRCNHCYFFSSASELDFPEKKELTDEEWIKVFKHHKNMGINSAALTGGEPTLRMNLLEEAVKIFPSVQIASNGIIKMPWFKTKKQPIYWVSLDGREETHNAIRGAEIFHKVTENIRNDKRVLISTTLTAMNYNEIEDVVKIAHDLGVSGLFFLMYTGYTGDPLLLKGKILRKTVKNILKAMKDYGDFILISKKMLELYVTKAHVKTCMMRSGTVRCYYPNGQRKFCVMGNSPKLCANCGCIVPVGSHALSSLDVETIEKLKKFPF